MLFSVDSVEGDLLVLLKGSLDHLGGIIIDGEVSKDAAGASSGVSGLHQVVILAQSNPLTEDLTIGDSDEGDVVLVAESLNELLVLGLITGVGEDAEDGLLGVIDGLANFVETLSQIFSVRSGLEDSLESTGEIQLLLDDFLNVLGINHFCVCVYIWGYIKGRWRCRSSYPCSKRYVVVNI